LIIFLLQQHKNTTPLPPLSRFFDFFFDLFFNKIAKKSLHIKNKCKNGIRFWNGFQQKVHFLFSEKMELLLKELPFYYFCKPN